MDKYEILEEYITSNRSAIDEGQVVTVEVRNTSTFERLIVKAKIFTPETKSVEADQLVLHNLAENVEADNWGIEIVEEIDPDDVQSVPQSDFRRNAPDGA